MKNYRHFSLGAVLLILLIGFALFFSMSSLKHDKAIGSRSADAQRGTPLLVFSTYIGGSRQDSIRDVTTDDDGNIYITGGTESPDFPTMPGAYDTTFNGWHDAYVAKFGSAGKLIWSTFLGGPNYDRAYAVKVDRQGYVYVAGRAGPGFPTTAGAFQPTYRGFYTGLAYGDQNAFVAKLTPDGTKLVFSTYVGTGSLCRDLAVDRSGDIYVPISFEKTKQTPPADWFTRALQKKPQGGTDSGIAKIRSDGSAVLWATYLGGSSDDSPAASLQIDDQGFVYILTHTKSYDLPTIAGAYSRSPHGGWDLYLAKIDPTGSNLIFGTYLGGKGDEFVSAHQLVLDRQRNVYVATWTASSDFPTTTGVVQPVYGGGKSDVAIAKISADGRRLLASTFIGGSGRENIEGIDSDADGNIYISGTTDSPDFPVTRDAFQLRNKGGEDGFIVKLSSDLTRILYATYLGGSGDDGNRSTAVQRDGSFLFAGWTKSDDFPVVNAFQSAHQGDWDGALARFTARSASKDGETK